jgi:hypothetical protein
MGDVEAIVDTEFTSGLGSGNWSCMGNGKIAGAAEN